VIYFFHFLHFSVICLHSLLNHFNLYYAFLLPFEDIFLNKFNLVLIFILQNYLYFDSLNYLLIDLCQFLAYFLTSYSNSKLLYFFHQYFFLESTHLIFLMYHQLILFFLLLVDFLFCNRLNHLFICHIKKLSEFS